MVFFKITPNAFIEPSLLIRTRVSLKNSNYLLGISSTPILAVILSQIKTEIVTFSNFPLLFPSLLYDRSLITLPSRTAAIVVEKRLLAQHSVGFGLFGLIKTNAIATILRFLRCLYGCQVTIGVGGRALLSMPMSSPRL